MNKDTRFIGFLAAVLALALLLVAYCGAYLALVIQKFEPHTGHAYAHYRLGGMHSRTVFRPVHDLDRQIRPDKWPTGSWPTANPLGALNPSNAASDDLPVVELPEFPEGKGRFPEPPLKRRQT